jgi:16S rRNA G966 N2-methylase RsmD
MNFSTFLRRTKNRIKYILTMNYKIQFSKFLYCRFALINDSKLGVDFYKNQTLAELGHPPDGELVHYGATRTYEIMKVLKAAGATNGDSIFDFGCGKGLGLVNFYRFGFKKVAGVELNSNICKIAKQNLRQLNIENITIINGDATLLEKELDEFNYFYFYNPFKGTIFSNVLKNIINSKNRSPRQITLIYNYPLERDLILKTGLFEIIHSYSPFFFGGEFLVFRSKP